MGSEMCIRDRTSPAPVLSPEVAGALAAGRPVVALESTLLAHGLPRPDNRAAADEVEAAVRAGGAVPATIAVLDGAPHVGLTAEQLDRVCADPDLAKLAVRDLPVALATGRSGATTVSSTALLAAAAGIGVFATGGLGGVHREAADTFDESADLTTLSRTPSLARSGSAHTRSTCSAVSPMCGTPSRTAIVAGTAPPFRTASSTWSAAARLSGRGRPWARRVLSSATTARPAASASATSGDRVRQEGGCTLPSWSAVDQGVQRESVRHPRAARRP